MIQDKLPPLEVFDASIVQTPLRGLLMNIDRDLEKRLEQAKHSGDRVAERHVTLLMIMLRFTINSYKAVCFLISTTDYSPKREDNFVLIVPPANRQLLDLLFTLVFMIDDFAARSLDYELSGYRELREEYDKVYGQFGSHPKWQPHLVALQALLRTTEQYLPITPQLKADLTLIRYWPSPYQLRDKSTKSQPFLKFLEKSLYGETSAEAHLHASGLMRVGAFMLSHLAPEEMQAVVEGRVIRQYTYLQFSRTLITVLAIASEIDTFLQLNNRDQAANVWGRLTGYVEEAKDVYAQRYQSTVT
jgi:hypothetical protein